MKATDKIRQQLQENSVVLYMKGTPREPRCGFSAKAAAALQSTEVEFAYVDVLAAPAFMQALPEVSDFPTFPQLFINGEIIGGSDLDGSRLFASGPARVGRDRRRRLY